MNTEDLINFIKQKAVDNSLSIEDIQYAANASNLSFHEIEKISLINGILPRHYQRNQRLIKLSEQLTLHNSCVAIVGCGGLGGHIIEMLARIGVGCLICIDHDFFKEENLNRQRFCNLRTLGKPKAEIIFEELKNINPAVVIRPYVTQFKPENAETILKGAQVVVDALDSFEARADLAASCIKLSLPLVHGAIAGWYGQIGVESIRGNKLEKFFKSSSGKNELQSELGNQSFIPALIAAMQVSETIKMLLSKDSVIFDKLVFCDLLTMTFDIVQF